MLVSVVFHVFEFAQNTWDIGSKIFMKANYAMVFCCIMQLLLINIHLQTLKILLQRFTVI